MCLAAVSMAIMELRRLPHPNRAPAAEVGAVEGNTTRQMHWTEDAKVALIERPLPACMVGIFVHTDKTGGTAVRSLLHAQAMHGDFDAVLFAPMRASGVWMTLVQNLVARAHARQAVRLLIEVHASQGSTADFWNEMLPDIVALRQLFEKQFTHIPPPSGGSSGCPVRLVTMFRKPLDQLLSHHHYSVHGRSPLCLYLPPTSIQLRLLVGLPYDGVLSRACLNESHAADVTGVLQSTFDFVGVTERWWESVLGIIDTFGLQHPSMVTTNVATGPRKPPTQLSCDPSDAATLAFVKARMETSAAVADMQKAQARRGAPLLQCRNFGCIIPGGGRGSHLNRSSGPITTFANRVWERGELCGEGTENARADVVLTRLCDAIQLSDPLYEAVLLHMDEHRSGRRLARAALLEERNSRTQLSDGNASCATCSKNRTSMFDHCWRRLRNYAEDPGHLNCVRTFAGARLSAMEGRRHIALSSCWQTCWTARNESGQGHCSAPCEDNEAGNFTWPFPSPLPREARREALMAVFNLSASQFYAGTWKASERRDLLSLAPPSVTGPLGRKLARTRFEFDSRESEGASWHGMPHLCT